MENRLFLLLFLLGCFAGVRQIGSAQGSSLPSDWIGKVDSTVYYAASQGKTNFIIWMAEQADLSEADALSTQAEKGAFVFERLTAVAQSTQKAVLQQLEQMRVDYQPFWISNMIAVRGDIAVIQIVAQRQEVARIAANLPAKYDEPVDIKGSVVINSSVSDDMFRELQSPKHQSYLQLHPKPAHIPQAIEGIEWGITKINAEDVWALGYTGQGVVVAGQDTGYQWDHPALKDPYRGWNGIVADHNYNWHDAIRMIDSHNTGANPCGLNLSAPCDDYGHGTHTMGSMVGDDGGSNRIGVAPGAEWISCRNMERGWGTPTTYAECFQWFMAPTDLNGLNPDPAKAPQVINNSWSCPPSEGCTDPLILQSVVENSRAAGILIVQAASNAGSACGTITTPAAIYDAVFSVGATDSGDNIAGFSSRGPVTVDGSGRFKPDISAPGVSVYSAVPTNSYGLMSGTSMAAPHVVGLAALLLSANPGLSGQVDKIEQIIRNTTVPLTTTQNCGAIPGSQSPNHTFGYGRIDALAAVNYALAPPDAVAAILSIGIDNTGDEELLSWSHDRSNCQYELHRSESPYFAPDGLSLLASFWADTTIHIDGMSPNGLGNPGLNYFYKLESKNCGVDTAVSNSVAEFDFALSLP